MARVLKWHVPVDDGWHPVGGGLVVGVRAVNERLVAVWTIEETTSPMTLPAIVCGTGQPLPENVVHVGMDVVEGLVWHLMRHSPTTPPPPNVLPCASGG